MNKRNILLILNIFFITLFGYAIFVLFFRQDMFDAQKILKNSMLQEKTFQPQIEEIISQKGIKAWLMQEQSAPIVALNFYFDKAGYAFEKEDKQGVAVLLSNMLEHGAGKFNEEEYHNILDLNAIAIDFSVTDNVFKVSAITPNANLNKTAELLKSVLTAPHLNQKDIQTSKLQQIELLKMKEEKPERVLSKIFREKFYSNHPNARESLGNVESISKLSRKDLKDFIAEHFTKDQLVVAIAGDISKEDATAFLSYIFDGLIEKRNVENLPELNVNYVFDEENIERDIPQVISTFVAPGTERLTKDFYPLYIANEIFGGSGLNSRLNKVAREREGLTYGVYTYLKTSKKAASIRGGFSTSKENYAQMKMILLEEWQKMANEGVTEQEFEAIKDHMLTSFNLRFRSLSDIAKQLLYMQQEHLGMDFLQKRNEYIKKVTLDEVNEAAKKYFSNKPSILTIGNN